MLFAMARWRSESPFRAVVRAVVVTESNTSSCSVGAGSAADPWPRDERSVLYGLLSAPNYRPVRRTRTPQRGAGAPEVGAPRAPWSTQCALCTGCTPCFGRTRRGGTRSAGRSGGGVDVDGVRLADARAATASGGELGGHA